MPVTGHEADTPVNRTLRTLAAFAVLALAVPAVGAAADGDDASLTLYLHGGARMDTESADRPAYDPNTVFGSWNGYVVTYRSGDLDASLTLPAGEALALDLYREPVTSGAYATRVVLDAFTDDGAITVADETVGPVDVASPLTDPDASRDDVFDQPGWGDVRVTLDEGVTLPAGASLRLTYTTLYDHHPVDALPRDHVNANALARPDILNYQDRAETPASLTLPLAE